MASLASKNVPVLASNFKKKDYAITTLDLKKQRENSPQFVSWQSYKGGKMVFQIEATVMVQHGMPQLGQYYETDDKRSFIKYPIDPSQPSSMAVRMMINNMDDYCEENQEKILGNKKLSKSYTYMRSLRKPVEPDELDLLDNDKQVTEKKERFEYVKLKLGLDLNKNITTKIYSKTKTVDPDTNVEKQNIKKEVVNTASDLEKIALSFDFKIYCSRK